MLIPEINLANINKIERDLYGRVSAVLLINKPVGITSHDVVDGVRRALQTRRVGHAGALDPFADGLLIVLVGKYTQYTEALIAQDKSYFAEVVFGLQTTTQDPEGDIIDQKPVEISDLPELPILQEQLQKAFMPKYEQSVPLFSSVKLKGEKLRVLARSAQEFEYLPDGKMKLNFANPFKYDGTVATSHIITLPRKEVKISALELASLEAETETKIVGQPIAGKFVSLKLSVSCSKGTYIRQLAEDIGQQLELPAFLTNLRRTSIASFSLAQAVSIEEVAALPLV